MFNNSNCNSNLFNTQNYAAVVEALRRNVPADFQNIGEDAISAPLSELRECAFIRGLNGVVAESHRYKINFLGQEDRFIQSLGWRERYLASNGIPCAVHVDLLAVEPNWSKTPRNAKLDLERFRRSLRLGGQSGQGDARDLNIGARRRYLVGANQYLEGPGVSVAKADYSRLTYDHYTSINTAREAWEAANLFRGAFSIGFLDRIDAPEYSVWRKYKDGSVLSIVVGGRFWADVDLKINGVMTFDPRTFAEFEVDRLSQISARTDHVAILAAAKDPRALKRSLDTFNLWTDGTVNDSPMWYF